MLMKWGAALGLASAGRVVAGGGGGPPLGDSTVWPAVADWVSLGTIAGPLRTGDRVQVDDLGTAHSIGIAERHGNEWRLIEGRFASGADLLTFTLAYPVHADALAEIKASGGQIEEAVTYVFRSGSWRRYADLTDGFAWPLTNLTNIDPSGLGATEIGDFGKYTDPTSGAVQDYRLRSVPAVGGGNLTVWVPVAIYGEAGLTIRAYLLGTETMPAPLPGNNIQGYTVTASGASASVTSSGGEVAIACTSAGHFANVQSTYALLASDRVYIRANLRLQQAAAVNITFFHLFYENGAGGSHFVTTQNPTLPSGNAGKYLSTTSGNVLVGSTAMVRSTGTPIPNIAELHEILADGTVEAGSPPNPTYMVNVSRNASPYFSIRRAAQTGTATGQHLLQVLSGAAGAQTARFSHLYFMTY